MRYHDLYLAGIGSWYPKPVPVEEAIADGRYDAVSQQRTGLLGVAVAGEDDTQPEMAVRAGTLAIRQSGLSPSDFGLLLHAVAGHNGLDGWNAASYLQHRLLDGHGISFEIRQLSNGAVCGLELAGAFLAAGTDRTAALITSADIFAAPVWDRWRLHPGLVFGDGAAAAVLSRREGFARILSVVTVCHPELEGMQRGDLAFRPHSDPAQYPVSLINRTRYFAEREFGMPEITRRMDAALCRAAGTATAEVGMRPADADHVVLPNFGKEMLQRECLRPLGVDLDRTNWRWALDVGHIGATDQFGAVDQLIQQGRLEPGQRILMVGIGGGFNWTAAVLEILHPS